MEYYDFIDSKSIREYYKEHNLPLSQRQIAAIIYNQTFSITNRISNFDKLYDMVDDNVKRDIMIYKESIKQNIDLLYHNDPDTIYSVYLDCDDHRMKPDRYFYNIKNAVEYATNNSDIWYTIVKCVVANGTADDIVSSEPISISFTKDKQVIGIMGSDMIEGEYERDADGHNSFTRYFKVQYPFRRGEEVLCHISEYDITNYTFDDMDDGEYDKYMSEPLTEVEEHNCDLEEYEVYVRDRAGFRLSVMPLLLDYDN